MPIRTVQDPPEARRIAERALTRSQRPDLFGLTIAPPAPIGALGLYNLTLENLLARRFENATLTGWRYVQLADGATLGKIADVTSDDGPVLAATAERALARTVADAGAGAEALLATATEDYEPRILRLPQVHMEALWLHGPEDRFFGLQGQHADLRDEDFVTVAVARAEKRRESGPSELPPGG
jgi:hypothetical protein